MPAAAPRAAGRSHIMAVARVTEIISGSKKSFEDAVEQGIGRASRTLKNVEGAWVQDLKVVVEKGKITEYRVNLKVTFILEK
jgi:flavin-binding protein dodecin